MTSGNCLKSFRNIFLVFALIMAAGCATGKTSVPTGEAAQQSASSLPLTDAEQGFKSALRAYQDGKAEHSYMLARRVMEAYPGSAWYGRSLFLSEQALIRLGRTASAEAVMLRIQQEYPDLADYALFLMAEHHVSQAAYSRAAALYGVLLERHSGSFLIERASLNMAQALEAGGYHLQAADAYSRFLEKHPGSDDASAAALGLGRSLHGAGDLAGAVREYRSVFIKYPGNSRDDEVEAALARCRQSGAIVPELTADELASRGRNLFRTQQYSRAHTVFSAALEKGLPAPARSEALVKSGVALFHLGRRPEASALLERAMRENELAGRGPEALKWLGRAYSRMGARDKAIQAYLRIVSAYPESEWADDALYLAGNVYRDGNDSAAAETLYSRLASEFPDSPLADSALWWNAWVSYSSGDFLRAEQRMGEIVRRYPRSFLAAQALYWQGRAIEKQGDIPRSLPIYQRVLKQSPYTYYGYLAAERVAGMEQPMPDAAAMDPAEPVDALAAAWDSQPEDGEGEGPPVWTEETLRALEAEPSFRKVLELMILGMKDAAAAELWDLQAKRPRRRGMLLALSKAFFELGDYHRSLLLVLRNYERYLERSSETAPPDLWFLAYPRGYWDNITVHAGAYGLDPHFIAAIIRQESVFHAGALSPAGARGVMQIMPSTGEWAARMIRLDGFDRERLYDTDVNIRLGTWYVSRLMKRFRNDPVLVAAAYNAGPGAVAGWIGRNADGIERDEFVENIPFTETRWYVKRVLANHAEYRRIYGREAPPLKVLGPDGGSIAVLSETGDGADIP